MGDQRLVRVEDNINKGVDLFSPDFSLQVEFSGDT